MLTEDMFHRNSSRYFLWREFILWQKNNMKDGGLPLQDRVLLCKKVIIESVKDELQLLLL